MSKRGLLDWISRLFCVTATMPPSQAAEAATADAAMIVNAQFDDLSQVPAKAAALLLHHALDVPVLNAIRFDDATSRDVQLHNAQATLTAAKAAGFSGRFSADQWVDGKDFANSLVFWRWLRSECSRSRRAAMFDGCSDGSDAAHRFNLSAPVRPLLLRSDPPLCIRQATTANAADRGDEEAPPRGGPLEAATGGCENVAPTAAGGHQSATTCVSRRLPGTAAATCANIIASAPSSVPYCPLVPCEECGHISRQLVEAANRDLHATRQQLAAVEAACRDRDLNRVLAALFSHNV